MLLQGNGEPITENRAVYLLSIIFREVGTPCKVFCLFEARCNPPKKLYPTIIY